MSHCGLEKQMRAFVTESNKIEGITRKPTDAELGEHNRFTNLETVTIQDLEQFVRVYQPRAVLRNVEGLNVRVGNHIPIPGGSEITVQLTDILTYVNTGGDPYKAHHMYETLHPFTDGNGRSGRILWLWQMIRRHGAEAAYSLPFLHRFYYQALNAGQSRRSFHVSELPAETIERIANSKMPEEFNHLDDLDGDEK